MCSVTKFGEISQLGLVFMSLAMFLSVLVILGTKLELLFCYWANFHCCTWTNIEQII